jgi:uncharacterized protein (DUF1501 family)
MLSRREFLRASSVISLSPAIPWVFGNTAHAVEAASDARILVVIQLDGGNDGINTVVPFGDDGYGRARNELRLDTEKLHLLNDHVGLHPSMRAFKDLFDDGRLAIVQGVGYPNPDRSHFRSMGIWQTARFDEADHDGYGWLGRTLDQQLVASTGTGAEAIFIGEQDTPVALWGRRSSATALSRSADLQLPAEFSSAGLNGDLEARQDGLLQFVTKQMLTAYTAADEFRRHHMKKGPRQDSSYPETQLGSRMKLMAELLKSGCQSRVFYTIQSGYDTHAAQLYAHAALLREFSDAVKSFLDDLRSAGLEDRVLVLAFSEFGRRVQENSSQGTDHGTAGPVFLAGTTMRPGLVGSAPDLSDLESGDLRVQTDFRSVYAAILDAWFRVDSELILYGLFDQIQLFKT